MVGSFGWVVDPNIVSSIPIKSSLELPIYGFGGWGCVFVFAP